MKKNRKDILLRAAYDLLKRSDEPGYVQEAQSILVRYDDADCDGACLMEDIAIELDIEDGTEPIALGEKGRWLMWKIGCTGRATITGG